MTASLRFSRTLAVPASAALRFGTAPAVEDDPPVDIPTIGVGVHRAVAVGWRAGSAAHALGHAAWRAATTAGVRSRTAWTAAAPLQRRGVKPWRAATGVGALAHLNARDGLAVLALARTSARDGARAQAMSRTSARDGTALAGRRRVPWQDGLRARRSVQLADGALTPVRLAGRIPAGGAAEAVSTRGAPWRGATGVFSLGGPWLPITPVTPPHPVPCYTPSPALRFTDSLTGLARLLFACRHAPALVRVPVRKVYMLVDAVSLARLSDGIAIPTLGLSLSVDFESWAWGFSATLPADALALIEPATPGGPCVLEALVNGTAVRVAVESISRERVFGQSTVRISGRGLAAALGDPYQPLSTFSSGSMLTSQQLLDQALPSGWDAEWGLTAWSVPAGAWMHQGTPITAALAIAAAGGGYVQPHATLQRLRVLPLYPVAPWDWHSATPDLELPSAIVQRESIEWVDRAVYNRVYVSGAAVGVLGRVTRAGTAGDVVAPMVTDPLTTHADAARQRGLAILANTGRQAWVTLRTKVLPETGIVVPGKLIRYTDGAASMTGLSRGLSIEHGRGGGLWQLIRIETHVEG